MLFKWCINVSSVRTLMRANDSTRLVLPVTLLQGRSPIAGLSGGVRQAVEQRRKPDHAQNGPRAPDADPQGRDAG